MFHSKPAMEASWQLIGASNSEDRGRTSYSGTFDASGHPGLGHTYGPDRPSGTADVCGHHAQGLAPPGSSWLLDPGLLLAPPG